MRRAIDQNQYCISTDMTPGDRIRSTRRYRGNSGVLVQEAPGGKGVPPGDGEEICGLWNSVRLAVETVPPGGSCRICDLWGAWRLAVRVPRQAVWKLWRLAVRVPR